MFEGRALCQNMGVGWESTALQSMTTVRIPTAEEEGFCEKNVINELIPRNTMGILIAIFGN